MLFETTNFLTFFIVFYSLFLLLSKKTDARLYLLLAASYLFCAQWDRRFLLMIIFYTGADCYLGKIEDCDHHQKKIAHCQCYFKPRCAGFFKY